MPDHHNDIFDAFRLYWGITTKVDKDKNEKLKDADGIYITREGDTVKAVAVKGLESVALGDKIEKLASATAKCSPDDAFDFNIGVKLAFDRLYEGYDMTPKPKREAYNGKIFVAKYPGGGRFHSRTIRQVVNGRVTNIIHPIDTNDNFGGPYIFKDMTTDQLSKAIKDVFWGSGDAEVLVYFVIE